MKTKIGIGAGVTILAGGVRTVAFHAERPEQLVAKGNRLFEQHKYAEASLLYRKAIQATPQYGEAYYRLGLSELELQYGTMACGGTRLVNCSLEMAKSERGWAICAR